MAESAQQPAQRYRRPLPGVSYTGGFQVGIPGANRPYAQLSDYIGQAGSALQTMRQLDLELETAKIEEKVAIGMVTPATDDPLKDNLIYKERFREVASDHLGKEAARTLESAAPGMITEAMSGYIFGGEHSPVEVFKESLDAWQEDYVETVLGEQNVSEFGGHPAFLNQLDAAKTRAYGALNDSVQNETVSQLMTTARGKIRDSLDSVRNANQELSPNFLRGLRDNFKDYPLKLRGENSIETLIHQEVVADALNTLQDPSTEEAEWLRAYQELQVLDEKGFAKSGLSLNAIVQGKAPSPKTSVLTTAEDLLHQRLKGATRDLKTGTTQEQQNWFRDYIGMTPLERSKLSRNHVRDNAPFAQLSNALTLHEEATSTGSAMPDAMKFKHNAFLLYPREPELDAFLATKPEWKDYFVEIKGQWADSNKAAEAQVKATTLTSTQNANFLAVTTGMLLDTRHDFIGDLEQEGPDGNPGINQAQVRSLRLKESVLLKTAAEELDTAQGIGMTAILNTTGFGSLKAAALETLLSTHKINSTNKAVLRSYHKAEIARLKELATAKKQTKKEADRATLRAAGRTLLTSQEGLKLLGSGGLVYIGGLNIKYEWDAADLAWAKAFHDYTKTVEADAESQEQYKLFLSLVQRNDLDKIPIAEFYEKIQFLKGSEQTLLASQRSEQDAKRKNLSEEDARVKRRNLGVSGVYYKDFMSDRAKETILLRERLFDLEQVDVDYLMAKMERIKSLELGYAEDKEFGVFQSFVNRMDLASVTTAQIEDELQEITNTDLKSAARREWQDQRALKLANDKAEETEERRVNALRAYGHLSNSENEEDLLALDFGLLKEDHPLFAPEGDQYRDTLIKLKRRIEGQRAESTVRMEQRRADERVRTLSQDTVISKRLLSNIELTEKWALENGINPNTLKLLRERQTEVRAVADETAAEIIADKDSTAELLRLFALSDAELLEQNISENTLLFEEDAVAAARLQDAAQRRAEQGVARTGADLVASLSGNTSPSRSLLLQTELTKEWAKDNNVTPGQLKILKDRKAVVKKEEDEEKKEVGKADASATELMRIWDLGDDDLIALGIPANTKLNDADKKKAQSLQDAALGRARDQKLIKEKSRRLFWKKKYSGDIGLLMETSDVDLTKNLGAGTGGLADVLILKSKEQARREGLGPEQTADSLMFEALASDLTGMTPQQIQELLPISGEGGLKSNEGRQQKLLEKWVAQQGEKDSDAAELKAKQSVHAVQRTTNDYYRRISLTRASLELDFTKQITQIQTIQTEASDTLAAEKQFVPLNAYANAEVKKLQDLRDTEDKTYTKEWRPHVTRWFNEIVKYPFDDLLPYKDPTTPTENMLIERVQVLIRKGVDLTEAHRVAKEIFDKNEDLNLDEVSAKMRPYLEDVREKVNESLPTWLSSATVGKEVLFTPSHVIDPAEIEAATGLKQNKSTGQFTDNETGETLSPDGAETIYLLKQIRN